MLKPISDEGTNTKKSTLGVSMHSVFFFIISLCVVFAASVQVWLYQQLQSSCSKVSAAPLVAAGCLFGSFITICFWRVSVNKAWPLLTKMALFEWVLLVCVGLVSVGMTFGQSLLYAEACPLIDESVQDESVRILQMISGVLLVLSVALPHVYKKKKTRGNQTVTVADKSGGPPVTAAGYVNENNMYRPLIFVRE
jgi:hypothetical protein